MGPSSGSGPPERFRRDEGLAARAWYWVGDGSSVRGGVSETRVVWTDERHDDEWCRRTVRGRSLGTLP